MGKIFASVFGGSGSKQKSQEQSTSQSQSSNIAYNQAYPDLQKAYQPQIDQGNQATDFIGSLLGLHGNPAADDAFNKYKDSSGYKFILDQGTRAIDNSAASKGMLHSGATMKALSDYGQNTSSSFLGDYLSQLLGLGTHGMQAGQIVSGAGNYSKGDSSSTANSSGSSKGSSYSKPGIAAFLGQAAAAAG